MKLKMDGICKSFGSNEVLKSVGFHLSEGEICALLGENGAGKSTFLKILSGELDSTTGEVSIDPNCRMSVLKQDHYQYDDHIVLDTVMMGNQRLYEIMKEKEALYAKEDFTDEDGIRASELEGEFADMNGWEAESDAATLLNGLGIPSDIHYTKMADLNGSQKVKVLLAQALFGNPDILLLDEPTNHLDLDAIYWLEEFLINFDNTVIVVSHDRYFINQTASRILELTNTKIINYLGNYDYYEEKCEELTKTYAPAIEKEKKVTSTSSGKQDYLERKAEAARTRKLKNDISKVEKEIKEKNLEVVYFVKDSIS